MAPYFKEIHNVILQTVFSITEKELRDQRHQTSCPIKFLEKLSETTTQYDSILGGIPEMYLGRDGSMFYGEDEGEKRRQSGEWYRLLKDFERRMNALAMNEWDVRIKWCILKKVFRLYSHDARVYYNNIDGDRRHGGGMRGVNEFLGLDIRDNYSPGWEHEFKTKILKQRYFTADKLYFWNDEGGIVEYSAIDGVPTWWSATIYCKITSSHLEPFSENLSHIIDSEEHIQIIYNELRDLPTYIDGNAFQNNDNTDEDSGDTDEDRDDIPDLVDSELFTETTTDDIQPNEAKKTLAELFSFIEEKKEVWNMNDGDYLTISNYMKKAFSLA